MGLTPSKIRLLEEFEYGCSCVLWAFSECSEAFLLPSQGDHERYTKPRLSYFVFVQYTGFYLHFDLWNLVRLRLTLLAYSFSYYISAREHLAPIREAMKHFQYSTDRRP